MIWSIFGGKAEAAPAQEEAPARYVWVVHFNNKIKGVTRGHRHALVAYATTAEGARLDALKQVRRKAGLILDDEEISHVTGGTRKA